MGSKVERNLTVVIDLSVLLHQLHAVIGSSSVSKEMYDPVVQAQTAWMMSLRWLGDLYPSDTGKAQVILACDQKDSQLKYWRHCYLAKPEVVAGIPQHKKADEKARMDLEALLHEYPGYSSGSPEVPEWAKDRIEALASRLTVHYKAGRKFPDPGFTKLKKDIYKLADARGWRSLRVAGYEADDVAAAIVKANSELPLVAQHNILLVTVDNDWLGMVSSRVSWFESQGRFPRLRDDVSLVNYWAMKREGYAVEAPRQIWEMKVAHGDKSDALPPGSPIEVIDLFQPPEGYRIWEEPGVAFIIQKWLELPTGVPVDAATADRAVEFLMSRGCPLCIKPFYPEAQTLLLMPA